LARNKAEWQSRGVEQRDVLGMNPEVVVGRQDGQTKRDQRTPADEQCPRATFADTAKELDHVELRAFHVEDYTLGSARMVPWMVPVTSRKVGIRSGKLRSSSLAVAAVWTPALAHGGREQ
jgi:hypothetical protein